MQIGSPAHRSRLAILESGWVKHIDWQPCVDSTHEQARRWLEVCQERCLPALFVADVQTAGRGRGARTWWSPPGCLMLTLAIDGGFFPRDSSLWGQLALVCGMAAAEAVEGCVASSCSVQLKWPNDVYLAGKKCAGILIESGPKSSWLIGIGINVNVSLEHAPAEVARRATSMHHHAMLPGNPIHSTLGRSQLDLALVLVELIERLQVWIPNWAEGRADWRLVWQQRCLLNGKTVRVRTARDVEICGICTGLDDCGQLLVRHDQGLSRIRSGEVLCWH